MANPFKPTFGVTPPLLVGREHLIESFLEGLDDGPGSPARATLYTGARGAGKTVMLNAIEQSARERGWIVISETAAPGFVRRLSQEHLPQLLAKLDPEASGHRLTGVTGPLGIGGATWESTDGPTRGPYLRPQVERLTTLLEENGTGLLITLDEIHRNQIAELRELAVTVQHAFRDERELAFVGAGLGSAISDVLNDDILTFLRRADRHAMGPVDRPDVARALREPIEAYGRSVADEPLDVMARGTRGYPFLIQLVGAQVWRRHPNETAISLEDAQHGVSSAHRRLGSLVHEPALASASGIDKSFLLAMANDDGPSKMADIQDRLDVDSNYASQYRLRLMAAELIEPTAHGYVDFAIPYLREYLREHAASDI